MPIGIKGWLPKLLIWLAKTALTKISEVALKLCEIFVCDAELGVKDNNLYVPNNSIDTYLDFIFYLLNYSNKNNKRYPYPSQEKYIKVY